MLHCSQSYRLVFSIPSAPMQTRFTLTSVYYLIISFPASAACCCFFMSWFRNKLYNSLLLWGIIIYIYNYHSISHEDALENKGNSIFTLI